MVNITKRFVESTNEPGYYRDSQLKGFVLKVTSKRKKVFLVNTKMKGTRRNVTVTLGKEYPTTTPAVARDMAKDVLHQLAKGIHPNEQKRKQQADEEAEKVRAEAEEKVYSLTLGKAFEDYLEYRKNKLKESTTKTYKYVFNARFDDWKEIRLIDITGDMVIERHAEISKQFKGEADHAMRILRAIFLFSIEKYELPNGQALIAVNPVRRLKNNWNRLQPREEKINFVDLPVWCSAVKSNCTNLVSDYLFFLILTGLRKNEASKLKWKQFADPRKGDSFMDLRTKSFTILNPKNGRNHNLPLTSYLEDIVNRRWEKRINEYVFPGKGDKGHLVDVRNAMRGVIDSVREQTGDSSFYFTPHALRRTFINAAKRLGVDPDFIRTLANHKSNGDVSSLHYTAMDDAERLACMQKINDWIIKEGKLDTN